MARRIIGHSERRALAIAQPNRQTVRTAGRAKVAIHGRDRSALSSVRSEIEQAGGRAIQVEAEALKFGNLEAMRRRIEEELGPIDILIANAGGSFTKPGPLEETSEEGWRASVGGNLAATFLTIKSILPGMKERKAGSIITISSAAGRRPHPQAPIPYAAAKAGIEMLTQRLATQVGRRGRSRHEPMKPAGEGPHKGSSGYPQGLTRYFARHIFPTYRT
jgi:NAD(P)-dependent dehydrogenase (short-subunit alcohol dehydrogenase family)